MTRTKPPVNVAASVRARLLELSRTRKVELQRVLADFAVERLLYRLGVSRHARRFVLKGAMLFKLWFKDHHRATWDLDLLGRGTGDVADVVESIREICSIRVDDGIVFEESSLAGEPIRTEDEYAGVRVRLVARLAEARIPVQVDVGFGDAAFPSPKKKRYPTLLDHPAPAVLVYPREAVVAEKLEAMISRGVTNSRMKDFYDIRLLASSLSFEGPALSKAVATTFTRRGTPVPGADPLVLTYEFLADPARQTQWRAFIRRARLEAPPDIRDLSDMLRRFLNPVLEAASKGEALASSWPPGGPWGSR